MIKDLRMIESIHFQNFKALRAATLPLAPFTLIVGPNGSGKSTAMEGLRFLWDPSAYRYERVVTAGWEREADASIEVVIKCLDAGTSARVISGLDFKGSFGPVQEGETQLRESIKKRLANFRVFHFDPNALARPVQTQQKTELGADGSNLAAVLNALSGREPERFEALNKELKRWLPEFDRVVFDFPGPGQVEFLLRTRLNHHRYRASDLSDRK